MAKAFGESRNCYNLHDKQLYRPNLKRLGKHNPFQARKVAIYEYRVGIRRFRYEVIIRGE